MEGSTIIYHIKRWPNLYHNRLHNDPELMILSGYSYGFSLSYDNDRSPNNTARTLDIYESYKFNVAPQSGTC